jgi:lysophospholipase L1-like esterase
LHVADDATDSITNGFKSSSGNGYRAALHDLLTRSGNEVDMIGSLKAGDMPDKDNEGHNGVTITQIASFTAAYKQRPNVILIHVGTNDTNTSSDPETAPQRLDSLVGQALDACPDATIVVARIIPASNAATQTRIRAYNNAITDLMAARLQKGAHIVVVNMPAALTTADLTDGLHPTDEGYEKMSYEWAIGLTAANAQGWIKDPVRGDSGSHLVPFSYDHNWIEQGEIANGAGRGGNLFLTVVCPKL